MLYSLCNGVPPSLFINLLFVYLMLFLQAELTKFQDAVLLLKDYYMSMTSETHFTCTLGMSDY